MDPMEQLWGKLSSPDDQGEKYIVYKNNYDLVYLYANGFVNAEKYTLDEWLQAFTDSKRKDGSYRLTHKQWLAKKLYRYDGLVDKPFDPNRLKEQEYTEVQFTAVLKKFMVPSTWLTEKSIPQVIKNYQERGKFKDGKILIDRTIKEDFAKMLQFFPSPLRMLQIDVHGLPKGVKLPTSTATTTSQFSTAPEQAREAARQLEALFQSPIKQSPQEVSSTGSATTTSLKDLMKKKRPPAGRV